MSRGYGCWGFGDLRSSVPRFRIRPVSYTHLDVYKRQALFLALLLLIQTSLSEQMQAALTFDSLTGAYSRRSILDELEHELRRCARLSLIHI